MIGCPNLQHQLEASLASVQYKCLDRVVSLKDGEGLPEEQQRHANAAEAASTSRWNLKGKAVMFSPAKFSIPPGRSFHCACVCAALYRHTQLSSGPNV